MGKSPYKDLLIRTSADTFASWTRAGRKEGRKEGKKEGAKEVRK